MNGLRLALRLAVPMTAYVLAATLALVIFIWSGVDIWVALIAVFGLLLVLAWYIDHRDKARKAGR